MPVPATNAPPPRARAERAARWALVLAWLVLIARFWHPFYGFTSLLRLDESAAAVTLPALRGAPIHAYPGMSGYDGLYYAQLAADPALRDPALAQAIDTLPYRARRILLSAVAWVAGGGDPVAAVRAYAWLNLAAWLGLAAVLWRIFPPGDWRRAFAWAGLLFSAGVLHSVRLALTDVTALLLLAGAWLRVRRDGWISAGLLVGLAALARETAVLGVVMLLPVSRAEARKAGAALAAAVLPLATWLAYLHYRLGPSEPGLGNFAWPLAGLAGKVREALQAIGTMDDRVLALSTLAALVSFLVQAAWMLRRREWRDPAWKLGAVHVVLLAGLAGAVWTGHPGAYTRVLLPLSLAFNILALARGAAWRWLVSGNLSVAAGLLALFDLPAERGEFGAGSAYMAHTDPRWYGLEQAGGKRWQWSGREAGLVIRVWPWRDQAARVRLQLRGFGARQVEVIHGGRVAWSGPVADKPQWIDLPQLPLDGPVLRLDVRCPGALSREGDQPGGRELGVAIFAVTAEMSPRR